MNLGVRIKLSAMMFLQYAIWGAWAPVLWPYLTGNLGLTDGQAGWVFGLLSLACILAPFTGGQIADRWVPTQVFLGVAHLLGGAFLILAAHAKDLTLILIHKGWLAGPAGTEPGAQAQPYFVVMMVLLGVYSLVYAPTLALTNSLGFHHIKDEKQFGTIRVLGTIGWIVAGLLLTVIRMQKLVPVDTADCLLLGGIVSLVMGLFCFFLPHTPPAKDKAADPLAFRQAFVLLKNPNFLIFMLIAFVVTTELQFYYGPTGTFLEKALLIPNASIPAVMSVAQAAEILAMALLLPIALKSWGIRKTLAIGVIAWPLRYIVFAAAPMGAVEVMRPLVIASLTLHGLGYTFFFVVSQIFVDMVAPKDIRASAQSLLALATIGMGNYLGSLFTGYIMGKYDPVHNVQAWTSVFMVPCALTVACAIAFLLFFKDIKKEPEPAEAPAAV